MTYQFSQKKEVNFLLKTRDFQIFNLRFCMNKIITINYNFFSLSIALCFNPFAPKPPVTARADPRPFYPL